MCFTEPAFPFRSSHTQITCSPVRAVTAALTLAGARRGYTFSRAHLACVNGLRNRSVYEDGSNSFSDPVLNGHPPSGQKLTYSCSTINPLVQVSHVQWQSKVCSFCKNSGHVCAECRALQQCILNRNQPLNQLGRLGNFTNPREKKNFLTINWADWNNRRINITMSNEPNIKFITIFKKSWVCSKQICKSCKQLRVCLFCYRHC